MLAEMTSGDLELWRAWYEVEPRGEERAERHTLLLAQLFIASTGGEFVSEAELLEHLRDGWTPRTLKEMAERKAKAEAKRKKKVDKQWAQIGAVAVAQEKSKRKRRSPVVDPSAD